MRAPLLLALWLAVLIAAPAAGGKRGDFARERSTHFLLLHDVEFDGSRSPREGHQPIVRQDGRRMSSPLENPGRVMALKTRRLL